MRVPLRYVLVWMGRDFPYYCRLAVESVAFADPDAAIELFVLGERPESTDLAAIERLPTVRVHPIDLDVVFGAVPDGTRLRQRFDEIPATAPAARSNLLRYALLWPDGGVYLDFDVIVRRPLASLTGGAAFVGSERVWKHDTARVEGRWRVSMLPATVAWAGAWAIVRADCRMTGGRLRTSRWLDRFAPAWTTVQPNNAVIGVPPRSPFIALLLSLALEADTKVRFALGPTLVTRAVDSCPGVVEVLPPEVLYPVPPSESIRFFADRTLELGDGNAVVHYVASNHRRLLSGTRRDDPRFAGARAPFWRLGDAVRVHGSPSDDGLADGSPLVSCLMVTRNRRELARRAVECFCAQTYPRLELLIVDDGDEDYSTMLAPFLERGHRIVYLRRRPDGLRLGGLRNVAIDAAAGEWCIQWDDDEWYHPERIERQLKLAAETEADAVALRWTLMSVRSPHHGDLAFRADTGLATPGTILHRRDLARYPDLARGEDSAFLRSVRRHGRLSVMGADASHLFIRCFHGHNTWDERHFVARLRRRVADWPSYAMARWWHRDLRQHRAFRLNPDEQAAMAAFTTRVATP